MSISRRKLLKGLGIVGLGSSMFPLFSSLSGINKEALADSHNSGAVGNNVLPKQWVRIIDLKKCDGCEGLRTGPQCCAADRSTYHSQKGKEWITVNKVTKKDGSSYWMPLPCMHCENAACVRVCPVGATYHDDNGTVLVDHRKCIGCRMCMSACPYQRRYFNWEETEITPKEAFSQYSPEFPVPRPKGTVEKCVLCASFTKDGKLPACIAGCPRGAMYFGDLERDVASNGNEVVALKKMLTENNAYRYKEELGTSPRVYYLPGHGQEQGREPRG